VPPIFLKTRTYLWTNIFHYGITKPWEQNDRIGKLFLTESLVERLPMMGRNPRTGEPVALPKRHSVRFKAGLDLATRVRDSVQRYSLKSNNE
jgi:hypothetical protein